MHYRPDIDGLRALAVLSVLFFHLGFSSFGGGYVGVDVFFVISGYLITRLIREEVQASDSFSFSRFYLRRARRLAPALFFTLALSFIAAVILFSPSDLERFSGALVHAVFSISNFYFWMESGYFDTEMMVKPLLHTWSLSVEEQFYLVWPATLVFLLLKTPRHTVPVVLVLAGLGSLAMNVDFYDGYSPLLHAIAPSISSWFSEGPATIYFLAPFRVFEFAIGAGLAFMGYRKTTPAILSDVLSVLGLAMISFAVVQYSEETPFPTVYALVPCVGAALLIYFGDTSRYVKLILSNRVMVRIGLISYSLYLIHWPIEVFFTYYTKTELSVVQQWSLAAVSIIAAEMMFRFIETPLRNYTKGSTNNTSRRFVYASALTAGLICLPAIAAWNSHGWTWRFGEGDAVKSFGDIKELRTDRSKYVLNYLNAQEDRAGAKRNILVVGDSLGHDIVIALAKNLDEDHSVQYERYIAPCFGIFLSDEKHDIDECEMIRDELGKSQKFQNADEIYVAFAMAPNFWATEFIPLLEYAQGRARPDARLVLFGRRPLYEDVHSIAVTMLAEGQTTDLVEQRAREIAGDHSTLDRKMRMAAGDMGIDFISAFDIACTKNSCRFFADDESLLFWDMHHWTLQGANWFGDKIVQALSGTFEVVVEAESPQIIQAPVPVPVPEPSRADDMPVEEALEITRSYMSVLSRVGIDPQNMYDVSVLPDSKTRITMALLKLMGISSDTEATANYQAGIILLAHFQPGVGEAGVTIDQMSAADKLWQDIVDQEKQDLRKVIVEHPVPKVPQLLGALN